MNEVAGLLEKRQIFVSEEPRSPASIQKEYVAKTKWTRLPAS